MNKPAKPKATPVQVAPKAFYIPVARIDVFHSFILANLLLMDRLLIVQNNG
jgi:hypothetical protein